MPSHSLLPRIASHLFAFAALCTSRLPAYQSTLSVDYNGNIGGIDPAKILNVARGGQSIIADHRWMPTFYDKLVEIGIREFRIDWLLSDHYYQVVSRNDKGELTYDFSRLDQVILPLAQRGITPIMCMAYMSDALGPMTGPPANYAEYQEVVRTYVRHYARHGHTGWAWESHNEPEGFTNLTATQTYQMYAAMARAVKEVDATARVGGYGAVGSDWAAYMNTFLNLYRNDVLAGTAPPMDFFSTHQYGGNDFHEVTYAENQFFSRGLTPPEIYLTEWNNSFGNGPNEGNAGVIGGGFDTNHSAAYVAMKLGRAFDSYWLRRACFFNFADTNLGQTFSGDVGLFTVDGHRKAAANVFWMYNRLGPTRLPVTATGTGAASREVHAIASKNPDTGETCVILWNFLSQGVELQLNLQNLPFASSNTRVKLERHLIDAQNGNYYHDYANGHRDATPGPNEFPALVETSVLTPVASLTRGEYLPPRSVIQVRLIPTTDPAHGRKLEGTPFGASPFWSNNPAFGFDKAFDGNTTTFYNFINANGGFVGLEFPQARTVTRARFFARPGFNRMAGGRFQGSNSSTTSGYVDLYTIPATPPAGWTEVELPPGSWRYLRYLGPNGGQGEISELEFIGAPDAPPAIQPFQSSILRNTSPGTTIGTISFQGNDPHLPPPKVHILSGNSHTAFSLDPDTGELRLATDLGNLEQASYHLQILASHSPPGPSSTATATAHIDVIPASSALRPGTIQALFFDNIAGTLVSNLTSHPRWPGQPNEIITLPLLEHSPSRAEDYGALVRGYLIPTASGNHTFWAAGDDKTELWLSSNESPANLTRIAHTPDWTSRRQWNKFSSQQSSPQTLTAGRPRYFEMRMKESNGGDHFAVAWNGPSTSGLTEVIPARNIAPFPLNLPPRVSAIQASVRSNAIRGTRIASAAPLGWNREAIEWSILGDTAGIFSIDAAGILRVANPTALAAATGTIPLTIIANSPGSPATSSQAQASVEIIPPSLVRTGLHREIWQNIRGGTLLPFLHSPRFPAMPDALLPISNLTQTSSIGDDYGSRIRVLLTPSVTGNHVFHLAANQDASLLLGPASTPSSASRIASVTNGTGINSFQAQSSQNSTPIHLLAGQSYHLELLHKEHDGDDHFSVAWTPPGGSAPTPIPQANLSSPDLNLPPTLQSASWQVLRTAANGTPVGRIRAQTPPFDPLTFEIISGNTGQAFAIHPDTGWISVANATPLASLGTITLTIRAQDSGAGGHFPLRETTTTVTIQPISGDNPQLRAWLPFNQSTGTSANDLSGAGNHATLHNGASFTPGRIGNALSLPGNNAHARLPSGIMSRIHDFTLAAWIRPSDHPTWTRVFDFGSGTANHMFLTTRSNNGTMRFEINNGSSRHVVNGPAPSSQLWTHVAVSLEGDYALLYLNGQIVGTNPAVTATPASLGNTTANFIGRSQFAADPYFTGLIDDFRIHDRALSPDEVRALAAIPPPSSPNLTANAPANGRIDLAWSAPPQGTDSLILESSDSPAGPFSTLATFTPNITRHSIYALPPGTRRSFRLTARSGIWSANPGNIATATTPNLAEEWRALHFGPSANSPLAADLADPDGDGRANLLEFAFGTNPLQPNPPLMALSRQQGNLSLDYPRSSTAAGHGMTFTAAWSNDLSQTTWNTHGVSHHQLTPADPNGNSLWRASMPMDSAGRFLRIEVSAPSPAAAAP